MEERYEFSDDAIDRITANGIAMVDLLYALYGSHPRVKRFRGDTLMTLAARDQQGRWVVVTCIERDSGSMAVELFEVGVARYASVEEIGLFIAMLKGAHNVADEEGAGGGTG